MTVRDPLIGLAESKHGGSSLAIYHALSSDPSERQVQQDLDADGSDPLWSAPACKSRLPLAMEQGRCACRRDSNNVHEPASRVQDETLGTIR